MLIALELAGFKSFADKTRFDFPDGITVIVGPNGSGKSNVVDAIKWVLGAQSAKALRGKDMADVIFKGSSSSGRKPSNSAEATLVFDNSQRQLPVDAEEVNVTRRVYRSGEGEYLINNQPCRLKDIKDLFRGTGVGVDAYSLIEQGKVDRMLQASPKDRRVIFEEAAGISRFNAKKTEAQRRLQRVDQNLVRLKDIVDEVHARLSALKNQANKAQRYREMTSRLHEIRQQLGYTEYLEHQSKCEQAETKLSQLVADRELKSLEVNEARQAAQHAELELHRVAEQCQAIESALQDTLQSIAVRKNQQQALRLRIEENAEEQNRQTARLSALRERVAAFKDELALATSEAEQIREIHDTANQRALSAQRNADRLREEVNGRTARLDELRQQHVELLRVSSERSSETAQQKKLLADILQSIAEAEQQSSDNKIAEQTARKSAEQAALRLKSIHEQNQAVASELEAGRSELESLQAQLTVQQESAAVHQGRLEGAAERLEILQQLQQHLEGVDAGARYILNLKSSGQPQFASVEGLVAELLNVDASFAPLIDTALGPSANAVVVSNGDLFQMARNGKLDVPGRLNLMRLDRITTRRFGEKVQLDGVKGVMGRADRLVRFEATYAPLFRYLLGTTWLVESLDVALELGHFRGAGLRFVTADCQMIEADGSLTLGSLLSSSGLVSRRSEISDANQEIAEYKSQYQKSQGEIERLSSRIAKLKPKLVELEQQSKSLSHEFAHQQANAQASVAKLDEIEFRAAEIEKQLSQNLAKKTSLEPEIEQLATISAATQEQIESIEQELRRHDALVRQHDADMSTVTEEHTTARVELARVEQKLQAANAVLEQCRRSQSERLQAVSEVQEELTRLQDKRTGAELEILGLTEKLSLDYLKSEQVQAQLEVLARSAAELRSRRSATAKQLDSVNRAIDRIVQQCEATELELERHKESCQLHVKRFADDYQIDFAELTNLPLIEDDSLRQAMDQEAAKLRQQISSVGEINLAALHELDQLQERYDYLNNQYEDLQAAKESLQRIIHKINADSRRLFMETLEAIRQNFQKLYRKSFGGGNADIILEEDADVLDCGIDIVATPPGKTALSNSLLSGGEKALTAVALLLAIFQYRPSPFCVLDEVDAPFDEANIGRFVSVLTEFLDWTKFIIVTHSKKTMTASTTLYGVTMQESGVSKQVAVRFEDVNDKGEIIKPPGQQTRRAA